MTSFFDDHAFKLFSIAYSSYYDAEFKGMLAYRVYNFNDF